MKKITKKNLDELEKEMPVVSENEQKDRMGRAVYVDYQGYIYGRIGTGLFYVLGSMEMYDYAVKNHLEYYGINLYEAGKDDLTGPMHPGREVQKKVFTRYARDVINYTGRISLVQDMYADDLYYHEGPNLQTGELCFNVIRSGIIFNEDMLTEGLRKVDRIIQGVPSGHIPGGDDPGMTDAERIQKQIDAIKEAIAFLDYEVMHAGDKEAQKREKERQQEMRMSYATQLYALWGSQGHAGMGYGIWDAYRKCGVTGY